MVILCLPLHIALETSLNDDTNLKPIKNENPKNIVTYIGMCTTRLTNTNLSSNTSN